MKKLPFFNELVWQYLADTTRFSPLSCAHVFLRRNAWPVDKPAASAGAQDDVPAA
jgi:hypothetical protein